MNIKFSLFFVLAALMAVLTPRAAHADLGYWTKTLVGNWIHPVTGDLYIFASDAKYYRTNDRSNSGYVSEEGWWKIVNPTDAESGGSMEGPVALILKTRKITRKVNGKEVTRSVKRDSRHVVNTVGAEDDTDPNFYLFDAVKLERVIVEDQ